MKVARCEVTTSKSSAFTLVELLVVISIIAVLAAILFPVFSRAREKSRQATCLNNLKQIAMGFTMYTQDYSNTMPPWTSNACDRSSPPAAGPGGIFGFRNLYYFLIDPYVKSGATPDANGGGTLLGVWSCPTMRLQQKSAIANNYGYNYIGLGGGSTSYMCTGKGPGMAPHYAPFTGTRYARPAPLADIAKPGQTIMITDGAQLIRPPAVVQANGSAADNSGVYGSHALGSGKIAPAKSLVTAKANLQAFTGTMTNVAYCDGHVKTVETQTLVPSTVKMEGGSWVGKAIGGETPEGNAGWTRD
jgi:prepilin-type N-terminal cleavage/methylation domain-containing protein/prepilin-type processing-associated H-X9-DG protein